MAEKAHKYCAKPCFAVPAMMERCCGAAKSAVQSKTYAMCIMFF
jgi:hypothetical protein